VDYRQNGAVSWSNGGSTSATSRSLTGLAADTSYDVRVTPNDGTEDGPDRTGLNLFQTQAEQVNTAPTQPGALSASAVTSNSATVSWGASSDADGDTITYQVDYRQNGAVSWSNGGSTSATSRSLTGLAADTSYDVRVTPNDGTEDGPDRTGLNLFQTDQAAQSNCLDLGALAYDNWTSSDAGGAGVLPAGAESVDYVRCKACHGWDRMGTDGGYHRRARQSGRPNAGAGDTDQTSRNISLAARQGTGVTADMILHAGDGRLFSEGAGSWVDLDDIHSATNKAMHSHGYTLGNQHPDYSAGALTQQQLDCLVEFLNSPEADHSAYFSDIDPSQEPVLYTMVSSADASAGESYYGLHCQSCHGEPGEESQANGPVGGILTYLDGDGKFSEFAHKVHWGIPGTAMNREAMGSPAAADVANMMLWLQELGQRGFAINPGLSGNWWGGKTRSGEGFLIDVAHNFMGDTIVVVSFYTYDSLRNQVWLIGSGTAVGNSAEVTLVMPAGAMWGDDFDPGDRVETPWGTGTFTFSSCGSGRMILAPNAEMQNNFFTDLEYDINRDILIPGIECPTPTAVD
jgi:cytochrome c2